MPLGVGASTCKAFGSLGARHTCRTYLRWKPPWRVRRRMHAHPACFLQGRSGRIGRACTPGETCPDRSHPIHAWAEFAESKTWAPELDEVLQEVSQSGHSRYEWESLKAVIAAKVEQVHTTDRSHDASLSVSWTARKACPNQSVNAGMC